MRKFTKNIRIYKSDKNVYTKLKTVLKDGKFMEWTKEQEQAIKLKGKNLLVAAAAREWKDSCFS